MTLLSYLSGITMYSTINASGHNNKFFYSMNTTYKWYWSEKIDIIGKLTSKDTQNIEILTIASKNVSINFVEQCLHILTNKDIMNGLKRITKMRLR